MEIVFSSRKVAGVPLLLARPSSAQGPLPLVLWFHGFGVDKEVHRKELAQIAGAGFLAVGVDAAGHGERRLPDLVARIDAPQAEALRTAVELAEATAREVPTVVRALVAEGLADGGHVAVAGISMGAFVVYRAVVEEPSLRAAVAILGSPEWPAGDSPHRHLDAFRRVALLSITAEHDENVPPGPARELHRRLAERHPRPERARYVELPGAVHLMGPADWDTTMAETLEWLVSHGRR